MNIILTKKQAFYAMQDFLNEYFKKTSSDSMGALLGCMQFLEDGITVDPVLWEDWNLILENKKNITSQQAFDAMSIFLHDFYKNTSSDNVKKLLNDIDSIDNDHNTVHKKQIWNNWLRCISTASSAQQDRILHLKK